MQNLMPCSEVIPGHYTDCFIITKVTEGCQSDNLYDPMIIMQSVYSPFSFSDVHSVDLMLSWRKSNKILNIETEEICYEFVLMR